MIQCERCRRHHRASDEACPFCRTGTNGLVRMMNFVGGAVTTVILAACYGTADYSDKYTYPTGETGGTGDTGSTTDQTTPEDTGATGETGGTGSVTSTGGTGATTTVGTGGTGSTTTVGTGGTGSTTTTTVPTGDTSVPTDTGGTDTGGTTVGIDNDGDGYFVPWDCNDADPEINPDFPEQCSDGVDNDCDGHVDAADPECP